MRAPETLYLAGLRCHSLILLKRVARFAINASLFSVWGVRVVTVLRVVRTRSVFWVNPANYSVEALHGSVHWASIRPFFSFDYLFANCLTKVVRNRTTSWVFVWHLTSFSIFALVSASSFAFFSIGSLVALSNCHEYQNLKSLEALTLNPETRDTFRCSITFVQ